MRAVDRDLDKVYELVKNNSNIELDIMREEVQNASVLYHLSHYRWHTFEWIPIDCNAKVLEIGSECGAITSYLISKVSQVYCVESDKQKMEINKLRHAKLPHVVFCDNGFYDVEAFTFDYIILPGSLARAEELVDKGQESYAYLLGMCKKMLKEDGHIIIATENRLGLKYWAGCKDDYFEELFVGIEGYANQNGYKTFSKSEIENLLKENKFTELTFYYPYPDYVFADYIYSDEWLPQKGELMNNQRNYEKDRHIFFDEFKVFNSIIGEGLFPQFSNSYLIIAR